MPPKRRRRRYDPTAAADLVGRYRNAPSGVRQAGDLQDAWAAAAEAFAEKTSVLRRSRNGIVTIACSDAGVAQRLASRAEALAAALERSAGVEVRALRVVIADHVVPARAPAASPPTPPTAAARAAASGLAAQVEDPQVRQALERAAAATLQRSWDG